jgi:hypothetical protein
VCICVRVYTCVCVCVCVCVCTITNYHHHHHQHQAADDAKALALALALAPLALPTPGAPRGGDTDRLEQRCQDALAALRVIRDRDPYNPPGPADPPTPLLVPTAPLPPLPCGLTVIVTVVLSVEGGLLSALGGAITVLHTDALTMPAAPAATPVLPLWPFAVATTVLALALCVLLSNRGPVISLSVGTLTPLLGIATMVCAGAGAGESDQLQMAFRCLLALALALHWTTALDFCREQCRGRPAAFAVCCAPILAATTVGISLLPTLAGLVRRTPSSLTALAFSLAFALDACLRLLAAVTVKRHLSSPCPCPEAHVDREVGDGGEGGVGARG